MLQLKDIIKVYGTGSGAVEALRGVSLNFRKSEFVSILGQSGCGKTTLLNVIGGLDQYTSGDLIINGRSTKEFRDADWDAYRNHSIGFVFQSYNLIPHQTVLANVELALTLSGVSKVERREKAKAALCRVGLEDQMYKKPNQMSGGQMQRVAIARALVNDPDILLADEPTGALDSATSVQIMEILKEISKDKLIIMVTHNPEIAEEYSTRIIRLLDGRVTGDSNPYLPTEEELATQKPLTLAEQKKKKDPKTKRTSMSFFTALALSFNNLMTKKARTFLTSFAGSIGIIGIALILSVSTGVNAYINSVQEETLSSYPITLKAQTLDMTSMMLSMMGAAGNGEQDLTEEVVYANTVMYELMSAFMSAETKENNLGGFLSYMKAHPEDFKKYTTAMQYLYDTSFDVYTKDIAGNTVKVDASDVFSSVLGDVSSSSMMTSYSSLMSSSSTMNIWQELIPGSEDEAGLRAPVSDMLKEQYQLLSGDWPTSYNEVVLIVNSRHEVSDMALYALGLKDRSELSDIMAAIMAQENYDAPLGEKWSYEEVRNLGLKLVLPTDYYTRAPGFTEDKPLFDKIENTDLIAADGVTLKISGIICPADGSTSSALTGSIGYTYHLTDYIIDNVLNSEIVDYQSRPENENYDVLTGLPFVINEENDKTDADKHTLFLSYVEELSEADKYKLYVAIKGAEVCPMEKMILDGQLKSLAKTDSENKPIKDENGAYVLDREKMEDFILENMNQLGADMNTDLIESYIARLDDKELADLVKKSIEDAIREMFRAQAITRLEKELDTVNAAELAAYRANALATLTQKAQNESLSLRAVKEGYLLENYQLLTALPQEAYAAYLTAQTDEGIDGLLNGLLDIQGKTALEKKVKEEAYRAEKAAGMLDAYLATVKTDADFAVLYEAHMPSDASESTLEENLALLGVVDVESPSQIVIYVSTFEDKEMINAGIDAYNAQITDESDRIDYTDYVAILMSSITTIIDAISYVLIAFVSISLVVSSIMIGIITYISVLERTKEIGILRAIGASKSDITRVFNAETLTVGFTAGAIGIGVTLLLNIVINIILYALTGLPHLKAALPWQGALILIGISMALTLLAGLLPARLAAKKDPVVALRTE